MFLQGLWIAELLSFANSSLLNREKLKCMSQDKRKSITFREEYGHGETDGMQSRTENGRLPSLILSQLPHPVPCANLDFCAAMAAGAVAPVL